MFSDSAPPPRAWFQRDWALLLLLSFLSLFIEVLLIRHLASEVRIFAYFKNLALIGSFIGLGFGYLYQRRLSLMVTAGALTLLGLAANPASGFGRISQYLSFADLNTWGGMASLPAAAFLAGALMLGALFTLIIIVMIPLGQRLGELFDHAPNRIAAYSVNIAGSLMGVWAFAMISFMELRPLWWGLIALGLLFASYRWKVKQAAVMGAMALALILADAGRSAISSELITWSPYQKIALGKNAVSYDAGGEIKTIPFYSLQTNDTIYMYLLDLSTAMRRQHPLVFPEKYDRYQYYDLPYTMAPRLDRALVLGAGGGNDVAAALRAGARKVTAVEIDPVIIRHGRTYHPEKPYSDPRVTVVENDARNFLKNDPGTYDIIILGLLDSHTLTSNFSNTNLDSFMYTRQSIEAMKARLAQDGLLALSFQVARPWIGEKLFQMVKDVFGAPPLVIHFPSDDRFIRGTGGTYFLAANDMGRVRGFVASDNLIQRLAQPSEALARQYEAASPAAPSDDWPYLYVERRAVPTLHWIVSALLALIFAVVYYRLFGRPGANDLHFAALGAGFLLLEVGVISRFTLFWGATWLVSSVVISLILTAILIANWLYLSLPKRIPYPVIYAALAAALVMAYVTPLSSNAVILLYLIPFTIIGYLFATSFAAANTGSRALAYNLFGALVGGLSESLSFVTGLSSLILLAAGFYALSLFALRRG